MKIFEIKKVNFNTPNVDEIILNRITQEDFMKSAEIKDDDFFLDLKKKLSQSNGSICFELIFGDMYFPYLVTDERLNGANEKDIFIKYYLSNSSNIIQINGYKLRSMYGGEEYKIKKFVTAGPFIKIEPCEIDYYTFITENANDLKYKSGKAYKLYVDDSNKITLYTQNMNKEEASSIIDKCKKIIKDKNKSNPWTLPTEELPPMDGIGSPGWHG